MNVVHEKTTKFSLNPEYAAEGMTSVTLLLTCNKCGKKFKVTKFATPPSATMLGPEPENEVIGNIVNTVSFEHSTIDKCNGQFSKKKV